MLGNILLFMKKFLKQNFICLHEYKYVNRKDTGDSYRECTKCEILKL